MGTGRCCLGMEALSTLIALYMGNTLIKCEFPEQKIGNARFDVFLDMGVDKSICQWFETAWCLYDTLQWRHNGCDMVSNHQPHDCLLNREFRRIKAHQSSASLAFVRGIHRGPMNSPHKWPVTRKMFPFDDDIMRTAMILLPHTDMLSLAGTSSRSGITPYQILNPRDGLRHILALLKQ